MLLTGRECSPLALAFGGEGMLNCTARRLREAVLGQTESSLQTLWALRTWSSLPLEGEYALAGNTNRSIGSFAHVEGDGSMM